MCARVYERVLIQLTNYVYPPAIPREIRELFRVTRGCFIIITTHKPVTTVERNGIMRNTKKTVCRGFRRKRLYYNIVIVSAANGRLNRIVCERNNKRREAIRHSGFGLTLHGVVVEKHPIRRFAKRCRVYYHRRSSKIWKTVLFCLLRVCSLTDTKGDKLSRVMLD